MAILKQLVNGDKGGLTWLEFEDSDGKRWKYNKGNPAQPGAVVHVAQGPNMKLEILVADDGQPVLRQPAPVCRPKWSSAFSPSRSGDRDRAYLSWPASAEAPTNTNSEAERRTGRPETARAGKSETPALSSATRWGIPCPESFGRPA